MTYVPVSSSQSRLPNKLVPTPLTVCMVGASNRLQIGKLVLDANGAHG